MPTKEIEIVKDKNFKDKINKQLAFNEFLQLFSNKTTHNDNILHEYLSGEH